MPPNSSGERVSQIDGIQVTPYPASSGARNIQYFKQRIPLDPGSQIHHLPVPRIEERKVTSSIDSTADSNSPKGNNKLLSIAGMPISN